MTLESVFQLAVILRRLGRVAEAQELHMLALDGRRRVLGDWDPNTMQSEDDLASTLKEAKLLRDAETMCRATLAKKIRLYGADDLRTVYTTNILAAILKDRALELKKANNNESLLATEALQECEKLSLACLRCRESTLGPEHPEVSTVTNMLGHATRYLGRLEESEKWHYRTLVARQEGPSGPITRTHGGVCGISSTSSLRPVQDCRGRSDEEEAAVQSESESNLDSQAELGRVCRWRQDSNCRGGS